MNLILGKIYVSKTVKTNKKRDNRVIEPQQRERVQKVVFTRWLAMCLEVNNNKHWPRENT